MLRLLTLLPERWTKRLVQGAALVRSPFSVGVRVIVEDDDKRVLLVRHSYIKGWYLPGGGVEGGESIDEAARREVREEAGIAAEGGLVLLNVYLNEEATGRDHIGLFHLACWSRAGNYLAPNGEIVEAAFFAPEALPPGVTPATERRLREFSSGAFPTGGRW